MKGEPPRSMAVHKSAEAARPTIPSWITDDLVADTIATWQPYYTEPLTEADAVGILQSVGHLLDTLEYKP